MSRKILGAVALAFGLCVSGAASAEDPPKPAAAVAPENDALVRRLIKSMRFEEQMDVMMRSMLPVMQEGIAREHPGLTAEQHQMLMEVTLEALRESFTPRMIDAVVPIYAEAYTRAELEAAVGFYESPAGRSILGKTAAIAPKVAQATRDLIPILQDEVLTRVCERIDCRSEDEKPRPS